jgi:hypothetical protein
MIDLLMALRKTGGVQSSTTRIGFISPLAVPGNLALHPAIKDLQRFLWGWNQMTCRENPIF